MLITIEVSDAENESLKDIAKKQELSVDRVIIQTLRLYQLYIDGVVELSRPNNLSKK